MMTIATGTIQRSNIGVHIIWSIPRPIRDARRRALPRRHTDLAWSADQIRSVSDQNLKALPDVVLGASIGNTRSRCLRLLEARPVLARHRSKETGSRRPQVFDEQAVRALALLAGIACPSDIGNQPIETLQAGGIGHYLIPTGTAFVRSTDFSWASLDASSALVE